MPSPALPVSILQVPAAVALTPPGPTPTPTQTQTQILDPGPRPRPKPRPRPTDPGPEPNPKRTPSLRDSRQNSEKMTNEPPRGVKANLAASFQDFTDAYFEKQPSSPRRESLRSCCTGVQAQEWPAEAVGYGGAGGRDVRRAGVEEEGGGGREDGVRRDAGRHRAGEADR